MKYNPLSIVAFLIGWHVAPLIKWEYTAYTAVGTVAALMILLFSIVTSSNSKE